MTKISFSIRHWFLIIAVIALGVVGPGNVEGYLHPAASPMTITSTTERHLTYTDVFGDQRTRTAIKFFGKTARLRPECNFEYVEWKLGHRGGRSAPLNVTLGRPQIRDNGEFDFGPWLAEINSVTDFKDNSFSDVYHQCFILGFKFPWLVKSRFWN